MNDLRPVIEETAALRQDLSAAFRICHAMGWSESVGNHFSAAVSEHEFLLNPCWQHFATIRPEDLLRIDARDGRVIEGTGAPDATALACLKDPTLVPIANNTARFYGRTAYDLDFGGIADAAEEGERLADSLGDKSVLVMGNHGVTIVGETVAEAFEDLYFFEKAAQTVILARSTGERLAVLSDAVAQNTADCWIAYRGMATRHFNYLQSQLPHLGV